MRGFLMKNVCVLQPVVRTGEKMAQLCRAFGISRKSGHKIFIAPRNAVCHPCLRYKPSPKSPE